MFELKRSEVLKEEVKINGEVITTNLNLTKSARETLRLIKELQVVKINLDNEKDLLSNLEKLSDTTIKLIKIFFGENADKVLEFYSDEVGENERTINSTNTEELLIEVMPFLFSLVPRIKEFAGEKQKEFNASIKGRKIL